MLGTPTFDGVLEALVKSPNLAAERIGERRQFGTKGRPQFLATLRLGGGEKIERTIDVSLVEAYSICFHRGAGTPSTQVKIEVHVVVGLCAVLSLDFQRFVQIEIHVVAVVAVVIAAVAAVGRDFCGPGP